PQLDRGNSVYDTRQRLVLNYVWQLPGQNLKGFKGAFLGGWSYNGIWAFQSGPHWQPFNSKNRKFKATNPGFTAAACGSAATFVQAGCINVGGDYTLDSGRNDRPDSTVSFFNPNRNSWALGWCPGGTPVGGCAASGGTPSQAGLPAFSSPCLGCVGDL